MEKFPPTVADSSTVADQGAKVRSALCGVPVKQTFQTGFALDLINEIMFEDDLHRVHAHQNPQVLFRIWRLVKVDWVRLIFISEIYLYWKYLLEVDYVTQFVLA